MIRIKRNKNGGSALAETSIAAGIFSAISGGLLMGFVSLERNFAATTDFATNHADQARISDYLARDLRRALTVIAATNDTTITIPSYYDSNGSPQTPTLDGAGDVLYGASGSFVTIRYYLLGSTIYRRQDSQTPIAIADNVKDFIFNVTDLGKVVNTQLTFNPTFCSRGASNAAIAATTFYNTTLLHNSGGVYQ